MQSSPLQEPLVLPFSGLRVPNRLVKAATTEKVCDYQPDDVKIHGRPSAALIRLYEEWGNGKYGMIITGNMLIDYQHLEAKGNVIIDARLCASEEDYALDFHKLVEAARSGGAETIVLAQLNHPGSQCTAHLQPYPVAPSDVQTRPAMGDTFGKPTPLTECEILQIVDRFAFAACVLYKAGFDGVQLHGAHGYLLTQFLSPHHNRRTDRWGGPLENRSRIIFEIIRAIRQKTPQNFSISIKLNSQDYIEDGFTTADCEELIMKLREVGIDFIEVTGGTYNSIEESFTYQSESTRRREAFFVAFAETVSRKLRELETPNIAGGGGYPQTTKVMLTGGFRTSSKMAEAIKARSADLIGLARPICAEPHLPKSIFDRLMPDMENRGSAESQNYDSDGPSHDSQGLSPASSLSPVSSILSPTTSDMSSLSSLSSTPSSPLIEIESLSSASLTNPSSLSMIETHTLALGHLTTCDKLSEYTCLSNLLPSMGLQIAGAGVQILDIAAGKAPRDFGKQDTVDGFLTELGIGR